MDRIQTTLAAPTGKARWPELVGHAAEALKLCNVHRCGCMQTLDAGRAGQDHVLQRVVGMKWH